MRSFHEYWAYVVIAANLIVGVWGIVLWKGKRGATRSFWTGLGIAWGSIYVQGFVGLLMFERNDPPFRHHFYGFLFAIMTIIAFAMRGEDARRRLFIFAAITLFIGIVAVRATLSL